MSVEVLAAPVKVSWGLGESAAIAVGAQGKGALREKLVSLPWTGWVWGALEMRHAGKPSSTCAVRCSGLSWGHAEPRGLWLCQYPQPSCSLPPVMGTLQTQMFKS